MSPSAEEALKQAKASIEAARKARGSESEVVKHYQTAKNTLAKVDITKTDTTVLKEMIAAFQVLAAVLDDSGEQLQERAAKCRQRADMLI